MSAGPERLRTKMKKLLNMNLFQAPLIGGRLRLQWGLV